ncbi:hypothetical protein KAJ61_01155 [Candidatus Parcubacteria bacterium]|nr:hypothetical protein [Candidatus Parcubacteria bacterium]
MKVAPFITGKIDNLNDLLQRARILRNSVATSKNAIFLNFGAIERFFEGRISDVLISNNLISEGFMLCGIYISNMLRDFVFCCPKSWYAIDYFEKAFEDGNLIQLKKGADLCFLLCSLFEERTNRTRGVMDRKAYIEIGGGLYYRFFSETKNDMGCHMARNFETMADVTKEAIERIKEK